MPILVPQNGAGEKRRAAATASPLPDVEQAARRYHGGPADHCLRPGRARDVPTHESAHAFRERILTPRTRR